MNEGTRVDDEAIELAELRSLSALFKARRKIAPAGGRALLEFLAAMRSELLELKVTSFCAQVLVDAVVRKIDAEFHAVRMRNVAYALGVGLVILLLFVLALVVPHPDHSLAEALGR